MRVRPRLFTANPWIRALLPALRTREAAAQELRWLARERPSGVSLAHAVRRRGRGYPLQYLLGSQPFGPLTIKVAPGVLIPRWETEEWASDLADRLRRHNATPRVLDLCTGTGCILFLLADVAGVCGTGLDVSARAGRVFNWNNRALHLGEHTAFVAGDVNSPIAALLAGTPGSLPELVTANPPYIPATEFWSTGGVEYSVRTFEPRLALIGDDAIYRSCVDRIIEVGARAAVVEVGSGSQIDVVSRGLRRAGWTSRSQLDGAGRPRSVWAWRGSEWSFMGE